MLGRDVSQLSDDQLCNLVAELERGRFDGIADLAEASALTITHTCVPQKIDELSGLPLLPLPIKRMD